MVCSLIFLACSTNSTDEKKTEVTEEAEALTPYFDKKFTGTINGKIAIEMLLKKSDTTISGSYTYKGQNTFLSLTGTVKNDGSFEMSEHIEKIASDGQIEQLNTGVFKGKMTGGSLSGTWSGNNKALPFDLKTDKSVVQFDAFAKRESIKAFPDKKESPEATMFFNYLQAKNMQNKSIEDKINVITARNILNDDKFSDPKQIEAAVNAHFKKYFTEYKNDTKTFESEGPIDDSNSMMLSYSSDLDLQVIGNKKNVLSIALYSYTFAGGAHGLPGTSYINIDVSKGEILDWRNIVASKDTTEFRAIAEKMFQTKYKIGGTYDQSGIVVGEGKDFNLSSAYGFTDEGIIFTYAAYEIGPYSIGMPFFTVPYAKIKHIILKGSVIDDFLKD